MNNEQLKRSHQVDVVGGVDLPDRLIRIVDDSDPTDRYMAHDELGQLLCDLLTLHPEVEFAARNEDVQKMDDATKSLLISDIQRILRIAEFKADRL